MHHLTDIKVIVEMVVLVVVVDHRVAAGSTPDPGGLRRGGVGAAANQGPVEPVPCARGSPRFSGGYFLSRAKGTVMGGQHTHENVHSGRS